jgi:hypothetical protein
MGCSGGAYVAVVVVIAVVVTVGHVQVSAHMVTLCGIRTAVAASAEFLEGTAAGHAPSVELVPFPSITGCVPGTSFADGRVAM